MSVEVRASALMDVAVCCPFQAVSKYVQDSLKARVDVNNEHRF